MKKLRDFICGRKMGTQIPGNPTEDREQPKNDIPGYEFEAAHEKRTKTRCA